MTAQPSPAGVARIRAMVDNPAHIAVRTAARMANVILDIYASKAQGELEAALIARGYSSGEIATHMPAALVIIDEFGRGGANGQKA